MSRARLAVAALVAALMAACGGGSSAPAKKADTGPIKIGLLMAQLREERWQRDRDLFVTHVGELHAKVQVQSADGDADKPREAKMLADAKALGSCVDPRRLHIVKAGRAAIPASATTG